MSGIQSEKLANQLSRGLVIVLVGICAFFLKRASDNLDLFVEKVQQMEIKFGRLDQQWNDFQKNMVEFENKKELREREKLREDNNADK